MEPTVIFSVSPWLLLLIIPVCAAILALLFTGKKRGSRITANRVISAVLQCAAATCCIFALSGIGVEYYSPAVPAELVILVDNSQTAAGSREQINDLVRDVLAANVTQCRVGVVLFGREQNVALKMGNYGAEEGYLQYLAASEQIPPDSATDISAALQLVWDPSPNARPLVNDPSRAKVLIISDGLETDGDAIGAMKSLTRDGVQIETSFFAEEYSADNSVLGISFPAQSLFANREFEMTVTVKSSFSAPTVLSYTDSDEEGNISSNSLPVDLNGGTQQFNIKHAFQTSGFHQISVQLAPVGTEPKENNYFCSYFQVAQDTKVLILETYGSESALLKSTLEGGEQGNLSIQTKLVSEAADITAEELAEYGEVILYNCAQRDMSQQFQTALYKYVNELGGGLFTVGGFEKEENGDIVMQPRFRQNDQEVPVRHGYNEQDLTGSVLASMLPVTVEEYKPAVAVVFIFDISSSMTATNGPIHTAAADTCYILDNVLDPRDYAGIVTLQSTYAQTDPLSPVTQKEALKASITELEDFYDFNACTQYAPALQQAADMLALAPQNVARRHIVLLSDGGPGDKFEEYGKVMEQAGKQGITITVVTYYKQTREFDGETYYFNHSYDVKGYEINIGNMQKLAEYGNGTFRLIQRSVTHGWDEAFKSDLRLDELGDIGYDSYNPKIGELTSSVLNGITNLQLKDITLGGYFPVRRKIAEGVVVPLLAEGSPLYAEWALGAGKVGSIMIDLEGVWSQDLFAGQAGKTLLGNIAGSLLRQTAAKPTIQAEIAENNFSTQVNVYGFEQGDRGEKLVAFVQSPDSFESPQKFDLSALSLGGNRFVFQNPKVGVYTVQILKVKAELDFASSAIQSAADIPADAVIEEIKLYRSFSYSKEYDRSADPFATGRELLAALSTREAKDGMAYSKFVYNGEDVFAQNGFIRRVKDPRQSLLISAITLYFAGIVIRMSKRITFGHKRGN